MAEKIKHGFTVLELLIVVAVIAILATVVYVGYNGTQKRAATTATMSALDNARETIDSDIAYDENNAVPSSLPSSVPATKNVTLTYKTTGGGKYSGLTAVQNGVLFHDICVELIADSYYSTIHAKDGDGTSSVVMSCDDNVLHNVMLITGWDSKSWSTPLAKATLQAYISSVPADSWWTDRQSVVQGFYTELINRFEARGGTWPITSFWDPWATSSNGGVLKESLPALDTSTPAGYCLQAQSTSYSSIVYKVTNSSSQPVEGSC